MVATDIARNATSQGQGFERGRRRRGEETNVEEERRKRRGGRGGEGTEGYRRRCITREAKKDEAAEEGEIRK